VVGLHNSRKQSDANIKTGPLTHALNCIRCWHRGTAEHWQ
jgi:hypothetical protein